MDRRGTVYVTGGSSREKAVYVFSPKGDLLRRAGAISGMGGNYPYKGVAVDDRGNLYVTNSRDHCIEVYDAYDEQDGQCPRLGSIGDGNLRGPYGLALSPGGNLYVIDEDPSIVKVFNLTNRTFLFSFSTPPAVRLNNLTFGPNGNLFITAVQQEYA